MNSTNAGPFNGSGELLGELVNSIRSRYLTGLTIWQIVATIIVMLMAYDQCMLHFLYEDLS
jgi:hypothetical protein